MMGHPQFFLQFFFTKLKKGAIDDRRKSVHSLSSFFSHVRYEKRRRRKDFDTPQNARKSDEREREREGRENGGGVFFSRARTINRSRTYVRSFIHSVFFADDY